MFRYEHGSQISYQWHLIAGVYLTQHAKRQGLEAIGLLQLQKLYLPIAILNVYMVERHVSGARKKISCTAYVVIFKL